jgi:mycothiol synthase
MTRNRMPVPVEPFDLLSASDADGRARHELFAAVKAEVDPGDPVPPLEFLRSALEHRAPPEHKREWVVREGGEIVGWASLGWAEWIANRDKAEGRIEVRSDRRRRGVGSALLAAVVDGAVAAGCTLLGFTTRDGTAGQPFLAARGAETRQPIRISHLRIAEVDRALLNDWVGRASERAGRYSLVGWDDPCPEEELERFTEVVHVMNTAPLDDLERDDDVWTPDDIRLWQACLGRRGHEGWTLCARDDDTGRYVGFTEMGFWPWAPTRGFQGDTGVHPDHRNRGLGRWLKAAMLLRLLDERPEVTVVETGNASSNDAMLAINVAMGFRPAHHGAYWQLKL